MNGQQACEAVVAATGVWLPSTDDVRVVGSSGGPRVRRNGCVGGHSADTDCRDVSSRRARMRRTWHVPADGSTGSTAPRVARASGAANAHARWRRQFGRAWPARSPLSAERNQHSALRQSLNFQVLLWLELLEAMSILSRLLPADAYDRKPDSRRRCAVTLMRKKLPAHAAHTSSGTACGSHLSAPPRLPPHARSMLFKQPRMCAATAYRRVSAAGLARSHRSYA